MTATVTMAETGDPVDERDPDRDRDRDRDRARGRHQNRDSSMTVNGTGLASESAVTARPERGWASPLHARRGRRSGPPTRTDVQKSNSLVFRGATQLPPGAGPGRAGPARHLRVFILAYFLALGGAPSFRGAAPARLLVARRRGS